MLLGVGHAGATPSNNGQTGYVNMPSASVEYDGYFGMGYSRDSPYGALWLSSTFVPFLQVTGRFVSVSGIPGFTNVPGEFGSGYGRYKDKVFDVKARLWGETALLPSVAVGATDLFGTQLFKGQYVVATKTFGAAKNVELSVGYGNKRPDGLFAGARWRPAGLPNWAVVAEYDTNDYAKDYRADATGAAERGKGGPALGLEYRWGWLGAQIARHRDHFSANAYVTVPLGTRQFLPQLTEPAYFNPKDAPPRPTLEQWNASGAHGAALVQALVRQNFKNIRVAVDGSALHLTLSNSRISEMGRAVGRASRTALAFAPTGVRSIRITYTKLDQPIATYEFQDIGRLSDYLNGLVGREAFLQTTLVRYANPDDRILDADQGMLAGIKDDDGVGFYAGRDGNIVQMSSEDRESNRFKLVPKIGFLFNDPGGALRYEVAAVASYDRKLGEGLFLNGSVKLDLAENISDATQTSNSTLPHVRSDIAEYKRGGKFQLNRLMLNKYTQLSERVYSRVSGGFYEEMFRGVGGQVMYLPKDSRWVADLSLDALEQRGYKGWFDKRDYRTVTALGALHYRLPYDMTVTARAGQFLAKDRGARLEFKRRFASGIELGAWYTRTNGRDITSPGSPSDPYHDKGIFMSIPLRAMLTADTQTNSGFYLAPWTRDVGQMVASPGDLYEMIENPRRDITSYDALGNFAERADEQNLAAVNPPMRTYGNVWPRFNARIEQSANAMPGLPGWARGTGLAAGVIAASALLDKPADRFAKKHQDSGAMRRYGNFGKTMPMVLAGMGGVALAFGDERLQGTGIIALQSVAASVGLAYGGKYLVGRARPGEERGPWEQAGAGSSRSNGSFPSGHSAIAFAAVTPFAMEYDAPWLYGVAALTSMGRVANRQHWVSDVVAGGVLGYAVGGWLWNSQRNSPSSSLSIAPGLKSVSVVYQKAY